jgi:hypothetical protein
MRLQVLLESLNTLLGLRLDRIPEVPRPIEEVRERPGRVTLLCEPGFAVVPS